MAEVAEPDEALLARYSAQDGCYTDCFAVDVPGVVSFEAYVAAFYTTWLFKLERAILKLAVKRPSTDAQAVELAAGRRDSFAAWDVEARAEDQLLMCDLAGRTRSWLMVAPADGGTRLYFGSAVVPVTGKDGKPTLGFGFSALLGFHKLYSKALLWSAVRKLKRAG